MAKAKKEAPKKKKAEAKPQKKPAAPEKEGFRGIVRIAGKDVKGQIKLRHALTRVRGISHTLALAAAKAISEKMKIGPDTPVGELSEKQIEDLDKILFSLQEHGVYTYLLNRRNDFRSGGDKHVIMNDLIFDVSQDVDREKKLYSWRGYRHTFGKKVRGQKTRNTGRKGMAVGVLRKAVVAAQAGKGGATKEKK